MTHAAVFQSATSSREKHFLRFRVALRLPPHLVPFTNPLCVLLCSSCASSMTETSNSTRSRGSTTMWGCPSSDAPCASIRETVTWCWSVPGRKVPRNMSQSCRLFSDACLSASYVKCQLFRYRKIALSFIGFVAFGSLSTTKFIQVLFKQAACLKNVCCMGKKTTGVRFFSFQKRLLFDRRPEIYRLNLDQGRFLKSYETQSP